MRRKERKTEAFENVRGEAAKYKSIFKTRNMRLAFPKTRFCLRLCAKESLSFTGQMSDQEEN